MQFGSLFSIAARHSEGERERRRGEGGGGGERGERKSLKAIVQNTVVTTNMCVCIYIYIYICVCVYILTGEVGPSLGRQNGNLPAKFLLHQ